MRQLLTFTNFLRLFLLLFLIFSLNKLDDAKTPWETAWGKRMVSGDEPSFKEHLKAGMYFGEVARAVGAGVLLLVSFGWNMGRGGKTETDIAFSRDGGTKAISPRLWWGVLGCLVVGAFMMRAPKMNQSFWGDEASAMTTYVHGMWRPAEKGKLQEQLKFEPVSWTQTFFSARNGANNHVFFSLTSRFCLDAWRKITGHTKEEFSEWVTRIPSLAGGLASLLTLALLLKQWGAPRIGLLSAAMLALHPWHIRYSTEARGYGLVLAMFPLALMILCLALEHNKWKHWLAFALLEFLMMWSWGGIMYALVTVNLTAVALLLCSGQRWRLLARFTTAHILAAVVFISLYAPHAPQIIKARERLLWIKGLPMDARWFHNLLAETFTGVPWHGLRLDNPELRSWEMLLKNSPLLAWVSMILMASLLIVGFITMWKRGKSAALFVSSVLAGAVVCTLHFKFVIGDELRTWYLNFTMPFLSIVMAFAIALIFERISKSFSNKPAAKSISFTGVTAMLVIMLLPILAMDVGEMKIAYEDFKSATAVTRGSSELQHPPAANSKVFTAWLWRHTPLYDPRGDTNTRSGPTLLKRIEEVKAASGELYVIVGFRELAENSSADMLAILNDPAVFEHRQTFYAQEDMHSLAVYRLR